MRRVLPFVRFTLIFILLNVLARPASAEDIKTLTKKAEGGNVEAQFHLGIAYYEGQGVPQDYVQSYFWFSLAASRSDGEDYKKYSGRRGQVAKILPPDKLMEAQQMTRDWEANHPR